MFNVYDNGRKCGSKFKGVGFSFGDLKKIHFSYFWSCLTEALHINTCFFSKQVTSNDFRVDCSCCGFFVFVSPIFCLWG